MGYSPEMDWQTLVAATVLQRAGRGTLMAVLTKTAFSTLDPKLRPEATTLFNLSRLYGSTIGIAAVQISIYCNTQAMHLALAEHLAPDRVSGCVFNGASKRGLAMLNQMITEQVGVVAVIDQFKILMSAMLSVSPLVLFLCKPYVRG